jgi:hypothetical protein
MTMPSSPASCPHDSSMYRPGRAPLDAMGSKLAHILPQRSASELQAGLHGRKPASLPDRLKAVALASPL